MSKNIYLLKMLCTIPTAIMLIFVGYLFYQAYQSYADENESMFSNIKNSVDKKVSIAGSATLLVIILCYVMGFISSTILAAVTIGAVLGLDYMGYLDSEDSA